MENSSTVDPVAETPESRDRDCALRFGLGLHSCAGPNGRGWHSHSYAQVIVSFQEPFPSESSPHDRPDAVSIFPPEMPHETLGDDHIIFDLSKTSIEYAADDLGLKGRLELKPLESGTDPAIEQLAGLLRRELRFSGTASLFYLESISYVLVSHVLRTYATAYPHPEPARRFSASALAKLTALVDERLEHGVDIQELATQFSCSPTVFTEKLRVSTGLTPWKFVQNRRITNAKRLLVRRSLALAEISALLGFTDQSHFSNVFRNATGVTPGNFRKNS